MRWTVIVIVAAALALGACAEAEDEDAASAPVAGSPATSTPVAQSPTIATPATPEPVPTRDPEAPEVTDLVVAAGYPLEIRNESAVPDPAGHVHIHGELMNTGDVALSRVQMAVTLYDEHGVFWGTQVGYASLPMLAPGDFSPYEVLTGPDFLPKGSTWRIEVTAAPAADWSPVPVTVLGGELGDDRLGRSQWRGQIRNDGATALAGLVIVVPMYDAAGDLVHEPFGQVRGPIEPGEVVDAVVTSFQPRIVPWETFTVKVQEFVAP
jgi:hypothetical protein